MRYQCLKWKFRFSAEHQSKWVNLYIYHNTKLFLMIKLQSWHFFRTKYKLRTYTRRENWLGSQVVVLSISYNVLPQFFANYYWIFYCNYSRYDNKRHLFQVYVSRSVWISAQTIIVMIPFNMPLLCWLCSCCTHRHVVM